jgi:hypothetical protein
MTDSASLWDPAGCQSAMGLQQETPWTCFDNAKQYQAQGLRQARCSKCDRWRWPHERCTDFSEECR